jgi:DNA modification methylase
VADNSGQVIGGNGTLREANKRGIPKRIIHTTGDELVVVVRDDIAPDDPRRQKLAIMDNSTTDTSEFEYLMLQEDFSIPELEDMGIEIPEDMLAIDDGEGTSGETEPDAVPEVEEEPVSVRGKVYQLGKHRLMCGDSTSQADIARLMAGSRARMLFTSPPYSDMREYNGGKDLSVGNLVNFIRCYAEYTDYQCINLGIQRKDGDVSEYWNDYLATARDSGYKLLAWNVWDKGSAGSIGQQKAMFPIRHEWIFVLGTEPFEINKTWEKLESNILKKNHRNKCRQKDGSTKYTSVGDTSNPLKAMESVITMNAELGVIRHEHPATFPVNLPLEYIKAMSSKGDVIIEPFGGSGSTLMACEQSGRICRTMELDEHYCDVIRKRWAEFVHGEGCDWQSLTPEVE